MLLIEGERQLVTTWKEKQFADLHLLRHTQLSTKSHGKKTT